MLLQQIPLLPPKCKINIKQHRTDNTILITNPLFELLLDTTSKHKQFYPISQVTCSCGTIHFNQFEHRASTFRYFFKLVNIISCALPKHRFSSQWLPCQQQAFLLVLTQLLTLSDRIHTMEVLLLKIVHGLHQTPVKQQNVKPKTVDLQLMEVL